MREITVKLYQYSELSDDAKKRAREWFLGTGADRDFAWDDIKDDAKQVGIELTGWDYGRYCEGELIDSFSTVIDKILKIHGIACEPYKTAMEYKAKLDEWTEERDDEREELEAEFLKSILEDYRIWMDKNCDYRQTEEYISETMEANEYEFTENGKRA
jgi:hypothetical protein